MNQADVAAGPFQVSVMVWLDFQISCEINKSFEWLLEGYVGQCLNVILDLEIELGEMIASAIIG